MIRDRHSGVISKFLRSARLFLPSVSGALIAASLFGLSSMAAASAEFQFRNVSHRPEILVPSESAAFEIVFSITHPADVSAEIYDDRNVLVARVSSEGTLEAGDHQLLWDCRDLNGQFVPPEAYRYVMVGNDKSRDEPVRYEPPVDRVATRTKALRVENKSQSKEVAYQLERASRVRIRAGIVRGGPLLKTVVDWVPRVPGSHAEEWDGWDVSHVLNLSTHPALGLLGSAFALPRNTLLVGPPSQAAKYIEGIDRSSTASADPARPVFAMFDFARQRGDKRGDVSVELSISSDSRTASAGETIAVSSEARVSVNAGSFDATRLQDERFEAVFFVDGVLAFETEVAFLPYSWNWTTEDVSPGEHIVSVNLRGFEGHFGFASTKVIVDDR